MVPLLLGDGSDFVREAQGFDEVWELEDALEPGDPVARQDLPFGNLSVKLGGLFISDRRSAHTTGFALHARKLFHLESLP